MKRRMTGLPLLLYLAALMFVPVITSSAANFDESPVGLTIEKWCQIEIKSDLEMTVTSAQISGGEVLSNDSAFVDILTNVNATLRCPTIVTLTRLGGTETQDVDSYTDHFIPGIPAPETIGNYSYIYYTPGDYLSQTTVTTTIKKDWELSDAGAFIGTLTLDLYETP
jgi:hypothetical protein